MGKFVDPVPDMLQSDVLKESPSGKGGVIEHVVMSPPALEGAENDIDSPCTASSSVGVNIKKGAAPV